MPTHPPTPREPHAPASPLPAAGSIAATPPPWDYTPADDGYGYVVVSRLHPGRCVMALRPGRQQAAPLIGDARYAVHAANAYPALVAERDALRAALRCVLAAKCPRDTNGDGDCGKPMCPWCGEAIRAALAAGWTGA